MTYATFNKNIMISLEDIYLEIFQGDNAKIKVKNPKIGVKKLVRIIEAALKLSNKKGFHAMSLRELCKESGLSMGGLYAYIESKEDLLQILYDQGRRILNQVMTEGLNGVTNPREKLNLAIKIHLYLSERMQPWFYFSYMETRFFNDTAKKKSISNELYTETIFKEILEHGCQSDQFKNVDPLFTASVIKAVLQDWYLKRWKYANRNVTVDQYAEFTLSWVNSFLLCSPSEDNASNKEN